ncbi:MAG: hypothetical protein HRU09_16435 [Oligoflexales bacterium]|nr:hypothetical protein [Oligoflexales bacterium]
MHAAQSQQIQNYLLWLQERGQCWPLVDALRQAPKAEEPEPENQTETLAENQELHQETELTPKPSSVPVPTPARVNPVPQGQLSTPLFRSAGNEHAPYLGLIDCVKGQKLVFGKERELLIKILSAIGIDLKSQFRLLGLETDHRCAPLASYQDYQQTFLNLVQQTRPKVIFSFGRLPYRIVSGDPMPFAERANKANNIIENAPTIFPMYHLCELLHSQKLKKLTWLGLKGLMQDL